MFYAHSVAGRPKTDWEPLEDHLRKVAERAAKFADTFSAGPWGYVAGLWHDLGKYHPSFQRKLDGARVQIEHAGAGALLASELLESSGELIAFAIAGHHTGLANPHSSPPTGGRTPLMQRLHNAQSALDEVRKASILPELPSGHALDSPAHWQACKDKNSLARRKAFFTRMLFSSLVDADRLETAAFMALAEGRPVPESMLKYDTLEALSSRLDAHIDQLSVTAAATPVNQVRREVLEACRNAAESLPGLFALTVPTGGGKTLSAMSFALRHATRHAMSRVIVVIPFTSIIEQNAQAYRDALGTDGKFDECNVLEHHSGIDEARALQENSEAELRRQQAAENWDAPIVVTTTVQFFESLFSDHPSRCRKLHRLARSVVVLDEVQTLPAQFLLVIVEALRELVDNYGCSIVLSTATPPALEAGPHLKVGLTTIRHIGEPARWFSEPAMRRVHVEWRIDKPTPYEELAAEISDEPQALVIVHRRADARILAELCKPQDRFHLSALMCPAHRLERLKEIKERLDDNAPCRVIATQLVEAGVNLDLPIVYRALCGLDSLAQAAGRCDREGKRTAELGAPAGRFIVFRAETPPPPGILWRAMNKTITLFNSAEDDLGGPLDPLAPEHCRAFFEDLYRDQELDERNLWREWNQSNFATLGQQFKLIEDAMRPIVVPWRDGAARIKEFLREPSCKTQRALQPFIVQVAARFQAALAAQGVIELWGQSAYLGLPTSLFGDERYHEEFGLNPDPNSPFEPELLMA